MASKKEILNKIRIFITQSFDSPQKAFDFFDKNQDGYLTKKELKKLIKSANVNAFVSSMVARKMIAGLDEDGNKKFDWREFKKAVEKLIAEDTSETKV